MNRAVHRGFLAVALALATAGGASADVKVEYDFELPLDHPYIGETPQFTHYVAPGYPERAWETLTQRAVAVRAQVDAEGRVTEIEVLKDAPMGLTEAVLDAVREWEIEPVWVDGAAAPATIVVVVTFIYSGSLAWAGTDADAVAQWRSDVAGMTAADPMACPPGVLSDAFVVRSTPEIDRLFEEVASDEDELLAWAARAHAARRWPAEDTRRLWEAMLDSRLDCVRCWGAEHLWSTSRKRRPMSLRSERVSDLEARWRAGKAGRTRHIVALDRDDRFIRAVLSDLTLREIRRRRAARSEPATLACPTGEPRHWVFFDRETRQPICEIDDPGR